MPHGLWVIFSIQMTFRTCSWSYGQLIVERFVCVFVCVRARACMCTHACIFIYTSAAIAVPATTALLIV